MHHSQQNLYSCIDLSVTLDFTVCCLLSALRVSLFIFYIPEINMSKHKICPLRTHSLTCSHHHDKTHVVMATGGSCFGDLMKQGDQGNNGSSLESLWWVGYGAKHRTIAASTSPSGSCCVLFFTLTFFCDHLHSDIHCD